MVLAVKCGGVIRLVGFILGSKPVDIVARGYLVEIGGGIGVNLNDFPVAFAELFAV